MPNFGFKVSKPGQDVKSCSDKQCIFTSKYGLMKVRMSGSIACTAGVWTSVIHNFGYYPNFFCFVDDTDDEGNSGIFPMGFLDIVNPIGLFLHTYATTTRLYIKSENTKTAYYYIFAEKGAL